MTASVAGEAARQRNSDFSHNRGLDADLAVLEREVAWRLFSAPVCDANALHRALEEIAMYRDEREVEGEK